jgi:hypothetical protein
METIIDIANLKRKIRIVESDIQTRFPNCGYTIKIILWNDGTDLIECKHGHIVNDKTILSTSTFYNGKLNYNENEMSGEIRMTEDENGKEIFWNKIK